MFNSEFSLFLNPFVREDSKSLIAIEDATISANEPTNNFGEDIRLKVGIEVDVLEAFIKFDLSKAPRDYNRIILKLEITDISSSGYLEFYETNTSWSEYTITWDNAPQQEVRVASGFIYTVGNINFELTEDILINQNMYSFCVTFSSQKIEITSRECTKEYTPPKIVIYFNTSNLSNIFTSIFVGIITSAILGLVLHRIYYRKD